MAFGGQCWQCLAQCRKWTNIQWLMSWQITYRSSALFIRMTQLVHCFPSLSPNLFTVRDNLPVNNNKNNFYFADDVVDCWQIEILLSHFEIINVVCLAFLFVIIAVRIDSISLWIARMKPAKFNAHWINALLLDSNHFRSHFGSDALDTSGINVVSKLCRFISKWSPNVEIIKRFNLTANNKMSSVYNKNARVK